MRGAGQRVVGPYGGLNVDLLVVVRALQRLELPRVLLGERVVVLVVRARELVELAAEQPVDLVALRELLGGAGPAAPPNWTRQKVAARWTTDCSNGAGRPRGGRGGGARRAGARAPSGRGRRARGRRGRGSGGGGRAGVRLEGEDDLGREDGAAASDGACSRSRPTSASAGSRRRGASCGAARRPCSTRRPSSSRRAPTGPRPLVARVADAAAEHVELVADGGEHRLERHRLVVVARRVVEQPVDERLHPVLNLLAVRARHLERAPRDRAAVLVAVLLEPLDEVADEEAAAPLEQEAALRRRPHHDADGGPTPTP